MIQLLVIIILFIGSALTLSVSNDEFLSDLEPTAYSEVNQLDGVAMSVSDETVTPTGLTLLFENETDTDIIYGESYVLETKVEGEWYQAPRETNEDYAYEDIGYVLLEQSSAELAVDWEWLFGNLDNGDYRIVKEVLDVAAPGDYDSFPLSAEFTIE